MIIKFGNVKRQETLELDLNEELVTIMVDILEPNAAI